MKLLPLLFIPYGFQPLLFNSSFALRTKLNSKMSVTLILPIDLGYLLHILEARITI